MRLGKITGLVAAVATAVTLAAVPAATEARTAADPSPHRSLAAGEADQLQALYRQAKAEGGQVTVYMGGDAPDMWDRLAAAFAQQFPEVELHLVTDLSKYHDARIDDQLDSGHLIADAAILQTTHDFDRWKREGELLRYKSVGWDRVFANAKDKDGFYTGVFYGAFSYIVNNGMLPANPADFRGTDLLEPEFKDELILTYPNDDDAVLFGFKQIVDQYGWNYLARLVEQNPTFVRGVPGPSAGVANGDYLATIAVGGDARPNGTQVFSDSERFTTWAQRGAIFKDAPHAAGAKLFLSWLTSRATQQQAIATWTWSVRDDVAPPAGLEPLASYANTDPADFVRFMSDRAAVEQFRSRVELYVGPVAGPNPADPAGTLGRTPGAF